MAFQTDSIRKSKKTLEITLQSVPCVRSDLALSQLLVGAKYGAKEPSMAHVVEMPLSIWSGPWAAEP